MANLNRRLFMKSMGAVSFTGSMGLLSGLSGMSASAASTSGYKALVCILLDGGMDHADTMIPYDSATYEQMTRVRPILTTAYGDRRARENLLRLNPSNEAELGGRQVAMPPELTEIHAMFEDGDAAIVSGVGPMIEPVTRAAMDSKTAILPSRLYSHNDQSATWMAMQPEGARLGWGGRFADAVISSNPNENPMFSAINTNATGLFLAGEQVRAFRTSAKGPELPRILRATPGPNEFAGIGSTDGDNRAREIMRAYFERTQTSKANLFQRDYRAAGARSIPSTEAFSAALSQGTPISTPFPDGNRLADNLKAIADVINIQQHIGNSRQVFFARLPGFDTHADQSEKLPLLQRTLSEAVAAFRDAMISINQWNSTTIFTMSEFGRTTVENGDGTDHGWGGHHLVMGGDVKGKTIYGNVPSMDVTGNEYTRYRGRLIPNQSVEQFAATLGNWFGLSSGEIDDIFPNLGNFDKRNLGFLS